jgi:bile acid:Na+ symporter, BASS family
METAYAALLIIALVLNGIALAGSTPLRVFFAPLRERRLVAGVVALDLVVVPLVAVGLAVLLRLDPVTRAALVIVAAASCGPIGIALSRVARGDMPLAVTTVVGLGALNIATVPLITRVLLPDSIPLGPLTIATSLLGLVIAPLLTGRLVDHLTTRLAVAHARREHWLAVIGRAADVSLAGAVGVAVFLEPQAAIEVLRGPVSLIALVVMTTVTLAARLITPDPARRRSIAITVNARAVGLALTLTALHLGDVPGLRTTVLAYGGLTQVVPLLVVLLARWWPRSAHRSATIG